MSQYLCGQWYKYIGLRTCCAFKTRQRDESLRYASEPVVMYSITPSIVMQKIKILNCRKIILYLI